MNIRRLTIIGANFAPEISGIAPYTAALAEGLTRHGWAVEVLTTQPHYPEWKIREEFRAWRSRETSGSVIVTRLRHYVPARPEGARRLLSELSFGWRVLFSAWRRPAAVLTVSPALFATAMVVARARMTRTPVVVWVQDLYGLGMAETQAGGRGAVRFVQFLEKRVLRSASAVVTIHDRFAQHLMQRVGLDEKKVHVVRNWTHIEDASPGETARTRRALRWDGPDIVVLHAGNMGVKQGLHNVVEAARLADQLRLPVRFVLMGDGSQRADLEMRASGIERLSIIDFVEADRFPVMLAAADVLLVSELDGVLDMAVPSKLTSYFAAGRPIVAAVNGEGATASEVHASGAGVVVDSGNARALINASLEVGAPEGAAESYGKAGRAFRKLVLSEDSALRGFDVVLGSVAEPVPIPRRDALSSR